MGKFELQIIRPKSEEKYEIEWLEASSPTGDFVVSSGHSPLISILKERSKVNYKKVGNKESSSFDVYGGILKVENNIAVVIIDL